MKTYRADKLSRFFRNAWYETEVDRSLANEIKHISEFTVIEEINGLPFYHDRTAPKFYEGPVTLPEAHWKPMSGKQIPDIL